MKRSNIGLWTALSAIAVALFAVQAFAQPVLSTETHPIQTLTLTTKQFLVNDIDAPGANIAGILRIPILMGNGDRLPAVLFMPALFPWGDDNWAQELNKMGVAVFTVDRFSGRRLFSNTEQRQLSALSGVFDAYKALSILAKHPRIDPSRIAIMGASWGGTVALYASNDRFKRMYGLSGEQFVAHIAVYPTCNVSYHEDTKTTGVPIRIFHGALDDWISIVPCRRYIERLRVAGADAELLELPGAYHAYDYSSLGNPVTLRDVASARSCNLEESLNGVVVNANTRKAFNLSDPCIENGAFVEYNDVAYHTTVEAVKSVLGAVFNSSK